MGGRPGDSLGCQRGIIVASVNHCYFLIDQISGQGRETIAVTLTPTVLNCNVLAFDIARLL